MSDLNVAALRAICAAATDGPWSADPTGSVCADVDLRPDGAGDLILPEGGPMEVAECYRDERRGERTANAAFIAAARTAVPVLLDELERLRTELAALDVDQPYHVLDVRENGWTLKHPLSCRPRLFDCPVNVACEQLDGPPAEVGRWAVDVGEDGGLLVRHRAEESETT